jgi:hypothetical protein
LATEIATTAISDMLALPFTKNSSIPAVQPTCWRAPNVRLATHGETWQNVRNV